MLDLIEGKAMKGKCLCGEVKFEIVGKLSNLYQCHCSLCQKSSGSACNSSLITDTNGVTWIRGEEKISSFTKENGYRSDFCSVCGSPVPNKMNIGDYMWIPAGLLEGAINKEIVARIYTESKASWEKVSENVKNYPDGPGSVDALMSKLYQH